MLGILTRIVTGETWDYRGTESSLEKSPIQPEDGGVDSSSEMEAPEDFDSSNETDMTDEELLESSELTVPIINVDSSDSAFESRRIDPLSYASDETSVSPDFSTTSELNDSFTSSRSCSIEDDSHEGGKGDGGKGNRVPPVLPSEDTCRRIVELVEFYLSDQNLVRDMFLLKHVTKHREGFVSLKLLSNYKKVKRLTRDWQVVGYALKQSRMLEVSNDMTKIRRRRPLSPELEEETRSFRTLLATNIPKEDACMEHLADFFGKFGEMNALRIHKPGTRTLQEVRQMEVFHPGLITQYCALVEYEKVHCARQAMKAITTNSEVRFKILEIPKKKTDDLRIAFSRESESAYFSQSELDESISPLLTRRHHYIPKSGSSSLASSPRASPMVPRRRGGCVSSPDSSPPSPLFPRRKLPMAFAEDHLESPDYFPRYEPPGSSPLPRRHLAAHPGLPSSTPDSPLLWRNLSKPLSDFSSAPASPLMHRRIFSKDDRSPRSTPVSSPSLRRRHEGCSNVPENILRFPRGPDGSRGFSFRPNFAVASVA
ncbi:la-related protein 6-like [Oratosquilla oratoria]|uniref:la-related protein 6-like n=1 Tax=Oratosquilla oratoria TaxID=337810 RepID=UPI003F771179